MRKQTSASSPRLLTRASWSQMLLLMPLSSRCPHKAAPCNQQKTLHLVNAPVQICDAPIPVHNGGLQVGRLLQEGALVQTLLLALASQLGRQHPAHRNGSDEGIKCCSCRPAGRKASCSLDLKLA